MTNRLKEEQRIEKIIRGLLKLPENRKCINCNSLGPQYVCTTFWTFVCTNCSGVHREFAHRVKSVSMAKFNGEELIAIQAGGNEKARQIYLKAWDPQLHSFPDGSNLQKLRDYIKHVYVDRKFTGERSVDKLPMVKVGAKEDIYERRSIERYSPGGRKDERNLKNYINERRSPHYKQENGIKEDFHERGSIERYSPGGRKGDRVPRSPYYKQENVRSGGRRSRPVNFEIVDDRFRDDSKRSGRRSEIRRHSAESRSGSRSPVSQKSMEMTGSPVVGSVKDILGENIPPLQVGQHPEVNDKKNTDGSTHVQKTASSSSPESVDEKLVEHKEVNSVSLIDFSTDPEPSDTIAAPQMEQLAPPVDGGNLALVPFSTKENASDASNVNSVESLLFELSANTIEPVGIVSDAPGSDNAPSATPAASSNIVSATSLPLTTNAQVVPSNGGVPASSPVGMAVPLPRRSSDSMLFPTIQQHLPSSTSPFVDSSYTAQQTTPSVGALYNQPWTASLAPSSQGPCSTFAEQLSEAASKPAQDTSSGVGPLAVQTADAKSSGRKELPADLFTASFHAPVSSWQIRPPHGMGFGMQYHPTAMPVSTVPNSAKSKNPFDFSDDAPQVQAPMFPSMSSLQGALPMASPPTGLLHTSNFCVNSSQPLQPQSSPYASAVPPQSSSNGIPIPTPPNALMGQHLPNNMPSFRPRGIGSFDGSEAAFGSLNTIQQPGGGYPTPTTSNAFSSMGGNPFG